MVLYKVLIKLYLVSFIKKFESNYEKVNFSDKISNSFMLIHGCNDCAWGETYTKENVPISNESNFHCS
jgi:hypothetical protein